MVRLNQKGVGPADFALPEPGSLLCCLPSFPVPDKLGYKHIFRVTIVQFLDRFNFCLGGVKRSCIHIVHPDGRIIPFDTYNLFYRGERERGVAEVAMAASR